jgi:uncharacterized protein (UPF0128 family)
VTINSSEESWKKHVLEGKGCKKNPRPLQTWLETGFSEDDVHVTQLQTVSALLFATVLNKNTLHAWCTHVRNFELSVNHFVYCNF